LSDPALNRRSFFGLEFQLDEALAERVPDIVNGPRQGFVNVRTISAVAPQDAAWQPRYRDREFALEDHRQGEWLRVRYAEGPTFDLKRDGSEVRAWWAPGSTLDDVAACVLGPIAGILLYLRGTSCLHASAIAYRGRALVFVGAAEAGKSTLAAAFARIGHQVLTDDILAIDGRDGDVFAQPAVPRIGLWPDSVQHLWGDVNALPRQSEGWDKRGFDLTNGILFHRTALPIGAVFVLADRKPDAAIRIESLKGTNAVLALIANKYVTRYSEREQNKGDFVLLAKLAASVPMRRITRSNALTDLRVTCEAILADYDALALAPA